MMARSLGGLFEVTAAESGLGREKAGWVVTGMDTNVGNLWVVFSSPRGLRGRLWGVDSHESRIKDLALLPPCSVTLS